jgi:mono/diheme cytochrome c family protein
MRRILALLITLAIVGLPVFWFLTKPETVDAAAMAGMTGDATRGSRIFYLGGCSSCHAAPDATGEAKMVLSGGKRFASPFGTFIAPNISPDPQHGIGSWQSIDLVNAMKFGTSPTGQHYYPAFPFTSYSKVKLADIVDLKAFMDTLPASQIASAPHEVPFPFNVRRGLGLWKLLFLRDDWVVAPDGLSEQALQGRELVEGLGHCTECHTARGPLGNLLIGKWMQGAPNPTGKGKIPALEGHDWSAGEIAEYLKSGFTPEFDTAGGEMADVVDNTSKLTDADRSAIAAYLKALEN